METITIRSEIFEARDTNKMIELVNDFIEKNNIIKVINIDIDRTICSVVGTLIYEE